MLEFIMAAVGAVGLGAFYIAILYNTYDISYTKSRRILGLVSVGLAVPLALSFFYAFFPIWGLTFGNESFDRFFQAAVAAPIMEESFKLWFFYLIFFRKKPQMGPFEGMFSFALVGLGFAVVEDCDYIIGYLFSHSGDPNAYFKIMYYRSFPMHVLFDGIAGYWIGHAGTGFFNQKGKQNNRPQNATGTPSINWDFIAKGYGIALGAHAAWNFIATVFTLWLSTPLLFLFLYFCIRLYKKYLRSARPPESVKIDIAYYEMLAYHRRVMRENRIAREKDLDYLVLVTLPAIFGLTILCFFAEAFIYMLRGVIWG
ncbi:MAG TPA: PrsW family glutamic-type intramembrane protease [archaeon]|nr:PrsW family glutamic-type intramembrane protease [archaeon]